MKISGAFDILSLNFSRPVCTRSETVVPIGPTRDADNGALQCNREPRAEYERAVQIYAEIAILSITKLTTCWHIELFLGIPPFSQSKTSKRVK